MARTVITRSTKSKDLKTPCREWVNILKPIVKTNKKKACLGAFKQTDAALNYTATEKSYNMIVESKEVVEEDEDEFEELENLDEEKPLTETTNKEIQKMKQDLYARERQALKDLGDENWENLVGLRGRMPEEMLNKFLEEYVLKLYNNSNVNMSIEQRNLYSKEKYYVLLKPVVELLKKYPDDTIQELKDKLFLLSGIEGKLKDFIYLKKMTPGVVINYGTNDYKETIVVGNREEVKLIDNKLVPSVSKMQEDTIFDLASITKLYTSISILKLVEKGLISLDDKITKYLPNFRNLKEDVNY